jgi:hypothetical protein
MGISPSDPNFLSQQLHFQHQILKNVQPDPTTDGWSTDPSQTDMGPAGEEPTVTYSNGALTLNSGSNQANTSTDLTNVYPGETVTFKYSLSLTPPVSGSYDRLSYYLTYMNSSGKQQTAYVSIDPSKSPGQVSFTIPSDASPNSPVTFTLHHEKDWGGTPESAVFSNMSFTSGSNPPPPTDPVAKWVQDIESSSNAGAVAVVTKAADLAKETLAKINLSQIKNDASKYENALQAYQKLPNPTLSDWQNLQSLYNTVQGEITNAQTQASGFKSWFDGQFSGIFYGNLQGGPSGNTANIINSATPGTGFTGSGTQMSEICDYMQNQLETEYASQIQQTISQIPTLDPLPPQPGPGPSEGGSGLSDDQECQALASDPDVQNLLSIMNGKGGTDPTMTSDYQALQAAKKQYQTDLAAGASPATLNADQQKISTASQTMLQYFVNAVQGIINAAPAGSAVASIASDYDPDQASLMLSHVEMLCTMLIQPPQSPGAPVNPNVPSQNYVPPPQISPNNLISSNPSNWIFDHGTAGQWNPNVPGDSPSGDQGCMEIDNSGATGSNYYEVHQNINTGSSGPGQQYLVAAYVQGPISNGQGDFLPAGITVSGDINYNGVQYSPQSYDDSAGTNQWHLVYFVVTADKANAQLQISLNAPAGGIAKFSDLQVIPLGSGQTPQQIQQTATSMYPPPSIAGNPGLGPFPQHESTYNPGDNLMDWPPSEWQNTDPKSAYPYWSQFGAGTYTNLVHLGDGKMGVALSPTSDNTAATTAYSPALVPRGGVYMYSCTVTIPNPPGNTFPGLDVYGTDYSTSPPTKVLLGHLDPHNDPNHYITNPDGSLKTGTFTVNFPIDSTKMPATTSAFQISASWSAYKGTGPFTISDVNMTADSDPATGGSAQWAQNAYNGINALNPYDTNRKIYNSQGEIYNASWNFANGTTGGDGLMSDWGESLVGNDISNPQAGNVKYVPGQGLVLSDTVSPDGSISDAGIQSSFMTAPGQPFDITTNMQFNTPNSPNKPVFALWTYGEAQKGDSNPLSHKSAGGGDTDNECDFELCPPNAQYPNGYFRAVTYAGWDAGGKPHSFENVPLPPGSDLWDGNPHSIKLHVEPLANGNCTVTWTVDGHDLYTYQSTPQDPGFPLGDSATYLKIATEQPYGWPGFTKTPGTSSFTISSIDYTQYPLPAGVDPSTLPPVSDSDYSYYMPGKGFAYTPFPSDWFQPDWFQQSQEWPQER